MAVRSLDGIYDRLGEAVKINFAKPVVIDAIVRQIDTEKRRFTVSNDMGDRTIFCCTMLDIAQMKINDHIRLKGILLFNMGVHETPYLEVEYYYTLEEHEVYAQKIDMYNKLGKILGREKCQLIMKNHQEQKAPEYVYNIGLVVCTADKNMLEYLIASFRDKCVGELYIYHIEDGANEKMLRSALEYFKKYNHINMVCVLCEKMSIDNILLYSSKENIAYLLHRKNSPYLVSIVDKSTGTVPLIGLLSNQTFYGINKFLDFVQNIQKNFAEMLETNIQIGMNEMENIIQRYRDRILQLEKSINHLNDVRFPRQIDANDPFEQVKNMLAKRLSKERIFLGNIQELFMKRIIDDATVKKIYTEIIDSHHRRNMLQCETKKIENKMSETVVDNSKLSINIQRQNGEF